MLLRQDENLALPLNRGAWAAVPSGGDAQVEKSVLPPVASETLRISSSSRKVGTFPSFETSSAKAAHSGSSRASTANPANNTRSRRDLVGCFSIGRECTDAGLRSQDSWAVYT